MKKYFGYFILFLTINALVACGNNTNEQANTTNAQENLEPIQKKSLENNGEGIAMAFYYQDSIATQFRFYREIDSMLSAKELAYHNELERKIRAYQAYEAEIQKRMDNNEITGYEIEEIQQTALQKQQAIQLYEQQKGEEIQRETFQYQAALMNKIAEAGKEFSEMKNIDLLFFYQKGGQITFINHAFDVTSDFILFLNNREEQLKSGFEQEVENIEVEK